MDPNPRPIFKDASLRNLITFNTPGYETERVYGLREIGRGSTGTLFSQARYGQSLVGQMGDPLAHGDSFGIVCYFSLAPAIR